MTTTISIESMAETIGAVRAEMGLATSRAKNRELTVQTVVGALLGVAMTMSYAAGQSFDPIDAAQRLHGGVTTDRSDEFARNIECRTPSPSIYGSRSRWTSSNALWPGGVVYYRFDGVTAQHQTQMRAAMDAIEEVCAVRFVPRAAQADFITIGNNPTLNEPVSWSTALGRTGVEQFIFISTNGNGTPDGWDAKYHMCHELMHALGLCHEQCRQDASPTNVQIVTTNISPGELGQFTLQGAADQGPYDFDSVMHYNQYSFAIDPQLPTIVCKPGHEQWQTLIGQRDHLSVGDQQGLVSRYGAVQCNGRWSALGTGINTYGGINDIVVVPGTQPPVLVAGGSFWSAGGVAVSNIASWNGNTWSALGAGQGYIGHLAVLPNGELVAAPPDGGSSPGGLTSIFRWNGSAWSPLGAGLDFQNGFASVLAVLPSGNLVAAGSFTRVSGLPANGLAVWNGNAWSAMGAGGAMRCLAVSPNGALIGGTATTTSRGTCVFRWSGAAWSPLGPEMESSPGYAAEVRCLAFLPNGDIIAGGHFVTAGGVTVNNIARWNGSTWSALGNGTGSSTVPSVWALAVLPNGDLVAGGNFSVMGNVPASSIARWNGSEWSALGSGVSWSASGVKWVLSLAALPGGDIVAGGSFGTADGIPVNHIARWTPSSGQAPIIVTQPLVQTVCHSRPTHFTVNAAGTGPRSYQWRHGVPRIAIPGATLATYAIAAATGAHAGPYDCLITNACGSVTTNAVMLTVCIADTDDGSGTGVCDGGVGIEDLLYYLGVYDAGTSRADVDDGTGTGHPDGGVGIEDLLYYLLRYNAGC